ncbi:MAG: hypothetical protein ICV66_11685, partial [Chitinophagaceae bacterium]|nr:hypothetical protein [Chitinophagaceae bacterium]
DKRKLAALNVKTEYDKGLVIPNDIAIDTANISAKKPLPIAAHLVHLPIIDSKPILISQTVAITAITGTIDEGKKLITSDAYCIKCLQSP